MSSVARLTNAKEKNALGNYIYFIVIDIPLRIFLVVVLLIIAVLCFLILSLSWLVGLILLRHYYGFTEYVFIGKDYKEKELAILDVTRIVLLVCGFCCCSALAKEKDINMVLQNEYEY